MHWAKLFVLFLTSVNPAYTSIAVYLQWLYFAPCSSAIEVPPMYVPTSRMFDPAGRTLAKSLRNLRASRLQRLLTLSSSLSSSELKLSLIESLY